jgi:predicted Fe-Mo cluster-binding NifX family protein
MRIGFTSQNFRTITGHAGRTRRFLVYDLAGDGTVTEQARIDLPIEMSMHEFHGPGAHPLDALDVLVTKECGAGFISRMGERGVVVVTSPDDTDPGSVLRAIAEGRIDVTKAAAQPCAGGHHHHHEHEHGHGHGHGEGHGRRHGAG